MIRIDCTSKSSSSARVDRVSSLGMLDRLPPEIVSILLSMLDPRSIANIASVSFRGDSFVQSHRPYRELVSYAPDVLVALAESRLIGLHSVAELNSVLHTEQCATCVGYGAFLFLPTCKRCCWECLRYHPSLRMLLPREARKYFALSERQMQQLPIHHVIVGNYNIGRDPAPDNCKLVSARAAKDLGLKVHGSPEKLLEAMSKRCRFPALFVTGRYFQDPQEVSQPRIYCCFLARAILHLISSLVWLPSPFPRSQNRAKLKTVCGARVAKSTCACIPLGASLVMPL